MVREVIKWYFKKIVCRAYIGRPRYVGRKYGDVDARHQEPHPVRREGGEKRPVQTPRGTTFLGTYFDIEPVKSVKEMYGT